MGFIEQNTVLRAIENISKIKPNKTDNTRDLLAYFLLFSRAGITKNTPKNFNQLNSSLKTALFDIGGLFSPNEIPGKQSCAFFSSFYYLKNESDKKKYFFNKGTEFEKLPGRIKDTIDNSLVDSLLELKKSDNEKYYIFKINVETLVKESYIPKHSLFNILIWLYRYYNFDTENLNTEQLYYKFLKDYNLTEDQVNEIFEYDINEENIDLSINFIDGETIRKALEIQDVVEIKEENSSNINNIIIIDKNELSKLNYNKNISFDKFIELLNKHKQIILYGVPGVGKSYLIEQIEKNRKDEYIVKKIQFHPNYTYQDFIWGQTIQNGNIIEKKGDFLTFLEKALSENNKDKKFILFIDEINRANTSSVFGELLYLLDRDKRIKIKELEKEISLPENFYIIGTMNSADRSIALVDYALRRRFLFIELLPDYNLIDKKISYKGKKILGNFLKKINTKIKNTLRNKNYLLGHSYFFIGKNSLNDSDLYEILRYKIYPIIEEYCHSDPYLINDILPEWLYDLSSPEELLEKIEKYINDE